MTKTFWAILLVAIFTFLGFSVMLGGSKNPPFKQVKPPSACSPYDLSGKIDTGELVALFEGKTIAVGNIAEADFPSNVLGVASGEKWIEVDLSDQRLKAWEGDRIYVETAVSTGLPGTPTPQGEFRIWIKLRAAKMEGGQGRYYYNLPNVPYVMYFGGSGIPNWKGYGLHGTYWHNDFGTRRSHGCVNLPTEIAKMLYEWTTPVLADGKGTVYSSPDNQGTRIVIHD